MDASNYDGDSEWRKLMFSAVSKKRKRGPEISEEERCEDIQECLDEEVDINATDENGDTVLHKAVTEGYLVVVKFLRDNKASIEIVNGKGLTAVALAEKLGKTEISKYLEDSCEEEIKQTCSGSSAPVDNQRPSDSARHRKRTHDTDNDDDEPAKKQRTSADQSSTIPNNIEPLRYPQGGLTSSLHGAIYQLKHYMLILQRASKLGYSFHLAKEMEAADKLDDLVLEYKDKNTTCLKHRFVQLKHKATEREQITASDLSNETDEDFSLLKYFTSWLKINKCPEFDKSVTKDYIICTNIKLDEEGLKKKEIIVEPSTEIDKFLEVTSRLEGKEPQCYKLTVDKSHSLFDVLKSASDIHHLAKELARHVSRDNNKLDLRTQIFKKYQVFLTKEVIDIGQKRFQKVFVKDGKLTIRAKKFHDIFLSYVRKMPGNKKKTAHEIWKELEDFKFDFSKAFGTGEAIQLRDDCISDDEISRFFKELTIAVHQPNETELTKIMSKDMAEKFNVRNADSLVNDFQTAVLDWFKESGTRGRYLTEINVENIYAVIWENFCTQVTIGLSLSYKEELRNYGIKFEPKNTNCKLQKFLSSDSASGQLLKLPSRQDTLLIVLSVYQTLESMAIYQKADSYILIKLERLKLPDVLKNILFAFGSSRSHILLIIDCAGNSDELHTLNTLKPLIEITNNDRNKKLILIDRISNDSSTSNEECVDIGFENLDKKSRAKLLERTVTFQGQAEISWRTLLGIRDLNNIGKEDQEDLAQIFDADTLVKLIQSKPIEIGKEVKGLDHHYINRTIIRHGAIRTRIPTEPVLTDLIATNESSFARLRALPKLFGQTGLVGPRDEECIRLEPGREADDFKTHCEKYPTRNIHWIEYQSETLICRQSTGGISNLVTYDYNTTDATSDDHTPIGVCLKENEVLKQDEHGCVIVISDIAGMGKSTILTEWTQKMKMKDPSLLVIRIDLSSPGNTTALSEETKHQSFDGGNTEKAIDFLVDKLVKPSFGSHIFKRLIMKVEGRAALLLDGFDELSPIYAQTVSKLLMALTKLRVKKLVVTTRPHTSEALERELKTRSCTLRPFSNEDQKEFLIEFWKSKCSSTDMNENTVKQMEDHAQKVIQSLSNSINDRLGAFTGIPLQTQMVAEVFLAVKREKLLNFPQIPARMNLIELYCKFVENKNDIYYAEKNHSDISNAGQMSERVIMRPIFDAAHQKLALDALFDEEIVPLLLRSQMTVDNYWSLWQRGHNNGERTGIVTRVIDGKPEFVHRTYAEYFAAKFLFNTLNATDPDQDLRKFFLADLFIAAKHETIRAFLDGILLHEHIAPNTEERWRWNFRKNSYRFETTALHQAAVENNIGIAKFLLRNSRSNNQMTQNITKGDDQTKICGTNSMKYSDHSESKQECRSEVRALDSELEDIDTQDGKGSTPLHKATLNENWEMAKYLIDEGANIYTQDEWDSTPLHNVVARGNFEIAKYLIDKGANIYTQDKDGKTPLHNLAWNKSLEIAKYIIDEGANVDTDDKGDRTPLREAALIGNWEMVEYLIDKGANIRTEDEMGRTLLHYVASGGNLKIAKYLIVKGAKIDAQDEEGRTPLHNVVRDDSLEVAKYLIDEGANIDAPDKKGKTPLHNVVWNNSLEIVKYLIDKGANIDAQDEEGRTPLHNVVWSDSLEAAKYLIDKGANIDTQDEMGRTPLHELACSGSLELAKYLIDKGANIHTQDTRGKTPLHEAARNDNREMAKHLIDEGANIDTPDKKGKTPLHSAAWSGNLEIAKYLINKGADMHTDDERGRTPLRYAAFGGNLEIAKYLIDNGANIDTQDEEGRTPLHNMPWSVSLEVVKYLIDEGANIDIQDKEGKTPLHCATWSGNLEWAKYMIDKGANIDAQDEEGRTPLHEAATGGDLKMAKYIIDQGANIHTQDKTGLTPLHVAVSRLCESSKQQTLCWPQPRLGKYLIAIIKLLLRRGADATVPDMKGSTPYELATSNSFITTNDLFNIDDWDESASSDLEDP